ncbi:MAG TPA: bifunctional riboflavin kinase/FAD synthetase [Bacteroidales bacterium]|nr:bifunctional riboflavin kinase/FAD synthetase [Bacteroidales bacterium]
MKVHTDLKQFNARNPVVTIGVFDGVHKGHHRILNRLVHKANQERGESVVITLWPHPRLVLKKDIDNLKLLNTLDEKEILLEQKGLDHLVILPFNQEVSNMSACEFIEQILVNKIGVQHLLIGHDHHFGKGRKGNFNDLKSCSVKYDFELERMEAEKIGEVKVSSTVTRSALVDGRLEEANEYLGYEYFMIGHVTGGHRIGKRIGFPTANIEVSYPYKLIPGDGVYAIRANVQGKWYHGMLNIGYRPTIDSHGHRKSIEAHLFDFNNDIYDHNIMIHFVKRIRDEQKFSHVDELVEQLKKDKERARAILQEDSR